jgi:carbon storage regulator
MLILQRKCGERVIIDHEIRVTVLEIHGNRVKLGFSGPPEIAVHREEVQQRLVSPESVLCGPCFRNGTGTQTDVDFV